MSNMKNTLLICLLALFACNSEKQEVGKNEAEGKAVTELPSWLLGTWQGLTPEGSVSESWEQVNDSTYSGLGVFTAGKDTVSREAIKLERRGGKVLYIPTVSQQNNGQAVSFTLTSSSEKELVFENPAHDFPQKIRYLKISADSIVAEISAKADGGEQSQKFPMKKI